jgi:hypothetical protein
VIIKKLIKINQREKVNPRVEIETAERNRKRGS